MSKTIDAGKVVGNGISSVVLNADYTLTINFTDGTSYKTSSIRGAQGETGATGPQGEHGDAGPNEVTNSTSTNITGLLKGNGTTVAQAVEGTDYLKEHQSLSAYRTAEEQDAIHDATKQNLISASNKLDTSLVGITTSSAVPATFEVNKLYDLGVQSALAIVLPATGALGDFVIVDFLSGNTATTLSITSTAGITDCDLVPEANTVYKMFFNWAQLDDDEYGWEIKYAEYQLAV